jgi:hypothetical protein
MGRNMPMNSTSYLYQTTVSKQVREISDDMREQLLERIKKRSPTFAIQLDEPADFSNLGQLLMYVCYCFENRVAKDLLFCQPLEGRSTGEDIFVKLNEFFIANELSWNNCVGVCTDGAPAMTGKKEGLLAQLKNLNNATDVIYYMHCIIHRLALVTKKIAPELNKVLQEAVTVVNFTSSLALNSRLFSKFCNAMGSNHDTLLDAKVRWLSRGRELRRLVELKEVKLFLTEENPTLADLFHNENWLCNLSYLTGTF